MTLETMKKVSNFDDLISSVYPGLVGQLKHKIKDSESKYAGSHSEITESFLWEHTVQVASIALKLSISEGMDPIIPVIAALFHDSGKFSRGKYHEDEIPEEENAAALAEKMLKKVGMKRDQMQKVVIGLRALYNDKVKGNAITDIVHDAEFLSKFGYLGAANFFLKSALRKKPLQNTILNALSKELTYASCLPSNMRSNSGRKMAKKKRRDSLSFFFGLLDDLCESQIACYKVDKLKLSCGRLPEKKIEVFLVVPSACETCGGKFSKEFYKEEGIKCKKLVRNVSCSGCDNNYNFSFCLPEIHADN